MQLRRLQYFLAAAERLNFHRAAEALGMSQPALTMQIQALEEDLGTRLFTREHQAISLTYAGAVFKNDAQALLEFVQHAVNLARRVKQSAAGFLRVGYVSSLATTHLLSTLLSTFAREYPGVALDLKNISTAEQISMLEQGRLDIGFLRLPVFPAPFLDILAIHKEPLALMLPAQHSLAGRREIKLQDLAQEPFVVYSRNGAPGYYDFIMGILEHAGFRPIIGQEAGEIYTMVSLVAVNLGVALGPASARQYNMAGVTFRCLDELPDVQIGVAVRTNNDSVECRGLMKLAAKVGAVLEKQRG